MVVANGGEMCWPQVFDDFIRSGRFFLLATGEGWQALAGSGWF